MSASTPSSQGSSKTISGTRFWARVILAFACGLSSLACAAADANDAAQAVAKEFSPYWNEYDSRIGRAMRKWGCEELGRVPGATVFYPFSGPDLPTVVQLFPDADRYVLVSLQNAGAPPRLGEATRSELEAYLVEFRKALKLYGALGFFRTDDLETIDDAPDARVGMTGPLMAFAARLGFEVESVEPISLELGHADVAPREGGSAAPATWDSVRLALSKGGRKVVVDYVNMDLRDGWLEQVLEARAWIERMAGHPTLLKAASHLLQEPGFSILRNALLENAPIIVQDETGIEYGALAEKFTVRLYGKFTRSNTSFAGDLQRTLAAAYRGAGVKPLPFRFGYEKNAGSALQVAERGAAPLRVACRR